MSRQADAVHRCLNMIICGGNLPQATRDSLEFAIKTAYDFGYFDGQRQSDREKKVDELLSEIV